MDMNLRRIIAAVSNGNFSKTGQLVGAASESSTAYIRHSGSSGARLRRRWQVFEKLLLAGLLHVSSTSLYAKPVIEKGEGLEVDWGNLRLRFYGAADLSKNNEDFSQTQTQAYQQGLRQVGDNVTSYFAKHYEAWTGGQKAPSSEVGKKVESASYLVRTEFTAAGQVRVVLESLLSRIMARDDLELLPDSNQSAENEPQCSGVLVKLTEASAPRAIYLVKDENGGEVLYSHQQIAKSAFIKNLMGRWFSAPTPQEITKNLGTSPCEIKATPDAQGQFIVNKTEWQQIKEKAGLALNQARIVISQF